MVLAKSFGPKTWFQRAEPVAFPQSNLKSNVGSLKVPLHYTIVVWAMLFGWLHWGERPDGATLIGAGIIVLSALLVVRIAPR